MKRNKHIKTGTYLIKNILLLQFIVMFASTSLGQDAQKDHNEQVTIRGTYDPTIDQAYKINIKPETFSLTAKKPEFQFQSIDVEQPTNISLEPIEPAKIRADVKTRSYNNSLKAGIGSWFSPYIDFEHSSSNSDAAFNAGFYHLSSFRNIPDYSPSPYSNTHLNFDWKKLSSTHIFSIGGLYGLNTTRYYGYKPDDYPTSNITDSDLKQMFNLVKLNLGLQSNYKRETSLHHEFKLSGYYYFDKYKSSETNVQFEFDLHKAFSVTKLLNYQHLGIKAKVEYYGNKDSIKSNSDVLPEAMPYFRAKYGIINFILGLKLAYLIAENPKFAFNPVLKVDVNIIPESLTLYGGIDGGLIKNSFLSLSDQNPWIVSTVQAGYPKKDQFRYQHNQFDISGGIRGNIAQQFGFNLQVRFLFFKDMPFFINTSGTTSYMSSLPLNKFMVIYDDGNLLNFSGEFTYQFGGNVKMWLKGEYNTYSLDSITQPYHKPISLVSLGGSYTIKKKVNIWIEAFLSGKRYALNTDYAFPQLWTDIEMDSYFDINLGMSYNISDTFSVWLSGTNLLNSNYQRYYNYPVQGLEIMGGIGIRF